LNNQLQTIVVNDKSFNIYLNNKTFIPTGTSDILLKSAIPFIENKNKNILDLGTGSGVLTIALSHFKPKLNFYSSDLSISSYKLSNLNYKKNNLQVINKCGNLFEPWGQFKFDYIVNDVSGISSKLASVSKWFNSVPSDSGIDGTKLTTKIIKNSKKYLNKNGIFFLPVLSLSNHKKTISYLSKNYKYSKKIGSKFWVMPKEFMKNDKNKNLLFLLKKKNQIDFQIKFGIYTWQTDIYASSDRKFF
tara:strand:+ start:746 stop:1483 length:738 start_codon:yes stop_codon:yes gene_type:complete